MAITWTPNSGWVDGGCGCGGVKKDPVPVPIQQGHTEVLFRNMSTRIEIGFISRREYRLQPNLISLDIDERDLPGLIQIPGIVWPLTDDLRRAASGTKAFTGRIIQP